MMDLGGLNPQQRIAVTTIRGPVLILAGAGTGKTRVITHRIAYLIDQGVPPSQILAVTFTNKAAREMKERVRRLVPRKLKKEDRESGPTICTFHSLGARILRRHAERLGYKRNFVIYSESEQLGVVRKVLSQISDQSEKIEPRKVLSMISRYKNDLCVGRKPDDRDTALLAERVIRRYNSSLHACNAVDFDDLLVLTIRLMEEHPEVLQQLRDRYQYVMVDEYQDTNAAQFKLLHLLTCQHRNLCVVGDDDQSIYGWRGAEIANLLDLEKHFPEVKVIKLEQNYRSTNTILEAANALIKNNPRRRGKQLWSTKGRGSLIAVQAFENEEEEARAVVDQIELARMSRRVPWGHNAVLFRTNQQSRPFEIALRQAGVRYHLIGGQSYFDRREVRDFMAYLKVLVNPHDDISLLRIANVPARGLSDLTMERLLAASQERHCSVYAAMRHTDVLEQLPARARECVRQFVTWVDEVRARLEHEPDLPLAEWSKSLMTEIGYLEELRRSEKKPETAENRIRNLIELTGALDRETDPAQPALLRIERFLEELTLDSEREAEDEGGEDQVRLITIHSCKGLEFPHVYVVGVEEGLLPHTHSKTEGTLDEERRLFYVAITRAQESLTLSYCLTRRRYGQPMPSHPSRFLNELPQELLDHCGLGEKRPLSEAEGKQLFAALRAQLR